MMAGALPVGASGAPVPSPAGMPRNGDCRADLLPYHVPPSVEEVYCALVHHDPMTGLDLRAATGMPRRTIYAALARLRELGLLKERASLKDTRQTYFWVVGPAARPQHA